MCASVQVCKISGGGLTRCGTISVPPEGPCPVAGEHELARLTLPLLPVYRRRHVDVHRWVPAP